MVVQLGDTAFQQPTQANLAAQYNGQLASSGDATNMGMFGSGIANPFGSNSGFNPLGMFKSGGNDAVIQQGGAQTQTQVTPDGKGGYTTASNPDAYATAGSVVQQNGITNNNGKLPYFSLDQNAFQNPVGNQAPAWQNAMNNYISNTTGPNVYSGAPSAQNTQLGQAATYNGAQIAAPVSANAAQLNGRQYNQSYNLEFFIFSL